MKREIAEAMPEEKKTDTLLEMGDKLRIYRMLADNTNMLMKIWKDYARLDTAHTLEMADALMERISYMNSAARNYHRGLLTTEEAERAIQEAYLGLHMA